MINAPAPERRSRAHHFNVIRHRPAAHLESEGDISTAGDHVMRPSQSRKPEPRILPRRRLALLALVATIAGAMLLAGPAGLSQLGQLPAFTAAHAAEATGPAGFADIV